MRSAQDFAKTYSNMSDDALLRLSGDQDSLLEEAKLVLKKEIERRQISEIDDPPDITSLVKAAEKKSIPPGHSWWARLLVFFGLDAVALTLVTVVFGAKLNSAALEALGSMAVYFPLAGWGILQMISGKWLTLRRTILIATIMYIAGIAWLAAQILR